MTILRVVYPPITRQVTFLATKLFWSPDRYASAYMRTTLALVWRMSLARCRTYASTNCHGWSFEQFVARAAPPYRA